MKLPRRIVGRLATHSAVGAHVRWHGLPGARRVAREPRGFWLRRRDIGSVASQRRIVAAIEAIGHKPTLH